MGAGICLGQEVEDTGRWGFKVLPRGCRVLCALLALQGLLSYSCIISVISGFLLEWVEDAAGRDGWMDAQASADGGG